MTCGSSPMSCGRRCWRCRNGSISPNGCWRVAVNGPPRSSTDGRGHRGLRPLRCPGDLLPREDRHRPGHRGTDPARDGGERPRARGRGRRAPCPPERGGGAARLHRTGAHRRKGGEGLMEDILAIILIFGGGTAIAISFSPVGKAIAERIRGRKQEYDTDPEVLADIDDLRAQLSEVQERLDFSERLLSKEPSKALSGGQE